MVYELLPELHLVRDLIRKRTAAYPRGCCLITSGVLEGLGFPEVRGYFRGGLPRKHCWNYDPETAAYFDLTARQFDEGLPDILVVTRQSPEAALMYVELDRTTDRPDLAKRRAEFRAALSRNGH